MRRGSHRSDTSVVTILTRSSSGVSYKRPVTKIRSQKEIQEYKKDIAFDDHLISIDELVKRYGTDVDTGLEEQVASDLLELNGPNLLVAPPTTSKYIILMGYLFGGFNVLLWMGAILTLIGFGISFTQEGSAANIEPLYFGCILVAVIMFSGFFGFYQERTNSAIMESFKKMVPKYATVVRSGNELTVPSEEIVLGDLVKVGAGDLVPADIRLIECHNLKVDNSSLTGESVAVTRSVDCNDLDPLETANLAFYSSNVVQGSGTGIVIRCGDHTVIGRIAGLTSALEKTETLIHKELRRFVRIITVFAVCLGTIFFIVSMLIGYSFFKSFNFFIAIVIANVPEGLPICLTACMSLTAKRMAKKNCLVKKLECIETLGACNVICSDKTGTLTQNKMQASHMFYDNNERSVLANFDNIDMENESYQALALIAILCNTAKFLDDDSKTAIKDKKTTGDASESAILKVMEQLEGDVVRKRKKYPKLCEIPFNSINKYQISIHLMPDDKCLLVMKGAPEKVLDHCGSILRDGEVMSMTPLHLKPVKKSITTLGSKGERVMAFADMVLPSNYGPNFKFNPDKPNFPVKGLRFVGMISMIDPPRASVPDAVSKCRSAGIRVIMVTGDHPVTALAIARKVGIISRNALCTYDFAFRDDISLSKVSEKDKSECTAAVVTGSDLRELSDIELEKILTTYPEIVFARTSPQQKLKIVEALQRLEKVVAVTGDGVNDSPALKKADIGIAMGITGTDVSKEAADMILLDDNFASIVTGIEEGRLIFDNLKKSIAYELTSNVPEIAPFLMLLMLNIPESLTVMAIIVIDVGTDLWPAISLAYEKPETDIMTRNPRNPKKDKLINRRLILVTYCQIGVIQAISSYVCFFLSMHIHGFKFSTLTGIRSDWENYNVNDLKDSYGQEWTFESREKLLRKGIASYFLSIVITQIADLLICKTRKLSLLEQGMSNHVLNAGLLFEIVLAVIVVYCPYINSVFQMEPVEAYVLVPALPFAFGIILYDECRKYLIRKYPGGFVYRHTYY